LAPSLAEALRLPYLGVVSGVSVSEGGRKVVVVKEFSGGFRGEYELPVPAVLGVQAAEKPPRYVPVAKVRSAARTGKIEIAEVPVPFKLTVLEVGRMYKPKLAGRAEMLEGSVQDIAERLADLLVERGII